MSITARALLLDAGFASLPLLNAVKSQGFTTIVCSGKAADPGHQFADISHVQNYAWREQVLDLAREQQITALLPGVTDVSYLTGAWVAQQLGLPGFDSPEVTETIFMKDRFREWATRHGYPVPQAVTTRDAAMNMAFPLLVKPVDAYSGLGISRVDEAFALDAALALAIQASASGDIVIESFCQGNLYSHSAFVRDGDIVCEYFVDEYCTVYPWQVNSSCLSVSLNDELRERVSDCMRSLVREAGLCDGLLHTQFIANDERFWLIELTRRCPGDLYSRLIELSTRTPYALWFTQPFLQQHSAFEARRPAVQRYIARHTVSLPEARRFTTFMYDSPARIVETVPLKLPGEWVQPAPGDRAGIVFAEFASRTALHAATPQLRYQFSLRPY